MSNYRTIKEYREDRKVLGRERFLTSFPWPVLLMPNSATDHKPTDAVSAGFMTKFQGGPTTPGGAPAKKHALVPVESFLVIPVVKNEGRPFPDRIGVGRTKGTDITLLDRDVSKYHGYFSIAGVVWSFTDVGSSNGTFIRGERLTAMTPTPVDDGMEIGFGNGRYVFRTSTTFCDVICAS